MPVEAIWALGFLTSISTIHLTMAWEEYPPDGVDMDRPINRALINALGWAVLAMVTIFAMQLSGLVFPPLFASAVWATWAFARQKISFRSVYWMAAPVGFVGLVNVIALFQIVFGDDFFGLANIFPER